MTYNIDDVIKVASGEIGYLEKRNGDIAYLYDKKANAGDANYTKYGYELRKLSANIDYPAAWCDCYIDWCFYQAYGADAAKYLLCGDFDDYTPNSAYQYKSAKQWFKTPERGDQIFFTNGSRINHTGLVTRVTNTRVYTIEGNTSNSEEVVVNGGCVCCKYYDLNNSRIAGYGRPRYGEQRGNYMFETKDVQLGSTGNHVLLLQEILRARGYKGVNNLLIELDGSCGANTQYAINKYQSDRRQQGVELGTNGRNDGICGVKMWRDIIAL